MSKCKDPTKTKYGRLTVLSQIAASRSMVCKCDCGRTVTVPEAKLLSGVTTSCGCRPGRVRDLTGQRYGELRVIEPVPGRATDGSVRWLCRCSCGEYVTVSSNKLRTGHTTSCGCRRRAALDRSMTYVDGTCVEILLSDKINANNTSGHKGVARKGTKWQAYITYRKKLYWLGTHSTYEEAVKARELAEEQLRDHIDEVLAQERPQAAADATA